MKSNNRQQLMDAINRRRPERIPYTYEAHPEADRRLRLHLGLDAETSVEEHFGCNRFTHAWEAFGWQRPRLPGREARLNPPEAVAAGRQTDIWGIVHATTQGPEGAEQHLAFSPLAEAETVADVEKHDWPDISEVQFPAPPTGDLAAYKRDRVVWLWGYTNIFSLTWNMFGLEKTMLNLALNPEVVAAAVARIVRFKAQMLGRIFALCPGLIDLVRSSDDWGSQQGLLISRQMAEEIFLPGYRQLLELAASHGAIGYQHSCGAIRELIPALVAAGVKVLNPIQTSAAGMVPHELKREFGGQLCFHGGIDTQQLLKHGSPEAVRAEVRRLIDELGPDGCIIGPAHNLQADLPPANIVAMYETVRELA